MNVPQEEQEGWGSLQAHELREAGWALWSPTSAPSGRVHQNRDEEHIGHSPHKHLPTALVPMGQLEPAVLQKPVRSLPSSPVRPQAALSDPGVPEPGPAVASATMPHPAGAWLSSVLPTRAAL